MTPSHVYDGHIPTDTEENDMSDIAKLPRWAQRRIEIAERNAAYWQAKAEAGPEESDTFAHAYSSLGAPGGTPLGTGVDIRFEFDSDTYILAKMSKWGLELHGTERRGSGGLIVRPSSNNMVRVQVGDDR